MFLIKSVKIFETCEYLLHEVNWSRTMEYRGNNQESDKYTDTIVQQTDDKRETTSTDVLQLLTDMPLNKLFRYWCFRRLNFARWILDSCKISVVKTAKLSEQLSRKSLESIDVWMVGQGSAVGLCGCRSIIYCEVEWPLAQAAQGLCRAFLLADILDMSGDGPEQLAAGGPARAGDLDPMIFNSLYQTQPFTDNSLCWSCNCQ